MWILSIAHMYYVGHGDPGSTAEGEFNNCLIDSLRQCIGVPCSRPAVRNDLIVRHQFDVGRARVTHDSYLDVGEHWTSILSSIFRHHTAATSVPSSLEDYCVIALYRDREGHGVVMGSLAARYTLVVMNSSDIHFDPCLPL